MILLLFTLIVQLSVLLEILDIVCVSWPTKFIFKIHSYSSANFLTCRDAMGLCHSLKYSGDESVAFSHWISADKKMSAGVAVAFKIEFGGHKTQTAFNILQITPTVQLIVNNIKFDSTLSAFDGQLNQI